MIEPYYDQKGISIYHGDNCDVLGQMPRECIDLVVTSPPYDDLRTYGGHSWDFYGVAWQLKRVLKPGGVIVWVVNDATKDGSETGTSMRQALHFQSLGLNIHDTMIYQKASPGGARGSQYSYWQSWEYVFVLSNGQLRTFNPIEDRKNVAESGVRVGGGKRNSDGSVTGCREILVKEHGRRTNIWKIVNQSAEVGDHPAIFPESLARDHILSWSNEGDTVLDPFSGSGTTVKMARETGRKGIGIEVNQEYCDIAVKRLSQQVFSFLAPSQTATEEPAE